MTTTTSTALATIQSVAASSSSLPGRMRDRRASVPFIDPRVLASRSVSTVVLSYSLIVAAIAATTSYLPTMLEMPRGLGGNYGFGLSATGMAVYCIVGGIATVLAGVVVGVASKRRHVRGSAARQGIPTSPTGWRDASRPVLQPVVGYTPRSITIRHPLWRGPCRGPDNQRKPGKPGH